ncbi:triose-phosphate isomerase [Enterococcus sp. BWB1-3]|uniref:triose-phosphate isomerase n=1 Tax=unclassified Enterococcus TaxID=2608891 RepID=UPI001920FAEA|nr:MULTISPECIES: triose-phosphate isomerase [unclassified Enterococcus]MBL1229094.1 triose-phosphate isomerase [Enterococcus sp. BWB1-3]MCB5953491.1 triose-phosphate isomerase [Enterococcus sp. CWB-B31]
MSRLRTPFFCVNPKAYLYGDSSLKLAITADCLAEKYDVDIFFTVQHADAYRIALQTKNLIITVQHMDYLEQGPGMGYILPEALAKIGVQATFLNHAEYPITYNELKKTIERAKQVGIKTIVCADSLEEGKAAALLEPTVIVCEPTELIGTGQTSDRTYMEQTKQAIKEISKEVYVLQAAGISTVEDVRQALLSGADGTGGTSGIVCADNPEAVLSQMIREVGEYKRGTST